MKTKHLEKLIKKSKNEFSIRVLYKKPQEIPEVKIIDNVQKLKQEIINKNLIIIPYETAFIVCNNYDLMKNMPLNIALILGYVSGDFILVNIDKKEREFKSLSQEDIIWYSKSLVNKSFNEFKTEKQITFTDFAEQYQKGFDERTRHTLEYKEKIVNVLTQIELLLKKILKNGM